MSFRRVLAVLGAAAVVLGLQVVPSYAAVSDLYVATGGDDTNACTQDSPCLTVQHAVDAADASGTTIHVGAGTFDGLVVSAKDVAIEGAGSDQTSLAAASEPALRVVDVGAGTTTLSGLTVHGVTAIPVLVYGTGHVVARHVVLDGGACSLTILAGQADLADSVVQNGGGSCNFGPGSSSKPLGGDIGIVTGSVALVRSEVRSPTSNHSGVDMVGGTFTADQTLFDDTANQSTSDISAGVDVRGGTADVSRSTFHAFDVGVMTQGGTAAVGDSTFFDNAVGVSAESGSAVVVRSTFLGDLGSLQTYDTGTLGVAGSVLGADSIKNCIGTITDLGYNLATDDTCGFTGTSHDSVAGLNLDTDLADRGGPQLPGGPLPTLAVFDPSSAVDTIPAGATYGDPASPLCPATGATDLRGVPRPVGGACDAGSMEMAGTTTALTAPTTSKPGGDVELVADVETPDVGVAGLESPPAGTVTFKAGSQVLCQGVLLHRGEALCTTSDLAPGRRHVIATYVPVPDASTLHPSTSPAQQVLVGIAPKVRGPHKVVVHVGKKATVILRGAGAPSPRFAVVEGRAPKGMKISRKAGKLTVSGKPSKSAVGKHRIKVRATNALGSRTRTVTIVVKR